jgi:IS5 family transposase
MPDEPSVFADAGYTGADQRPEHEDREVCWNIAIRRSIIKALPTGLRELALQVDPVRAVDPFYSIVNIFDCMSFS